MILLWHSASLDGYFEGAPSLNVENALVIFYLSLASFTLVVIKKLTATLQLKKVHFYFILKFFSPENVFNEKFSTSLLKSGFDDYQVFIVLIKLATCINDNIYKF